MRSEGKNIYISAVDYDKEDIILQYKLSSMTSRETKVSLNYLCKDAQLNILLAFFVSRSSEICNYFGSYYLYNSF